MNRWIILHPKTYIYDKEKIKKNTRNNKAKFNQ